MDEIAIDRLAVRVPAPPGLTPTMIRQVRRILRAEPLRDRTGFELRRRSKLIGGRIRFGAVTLTVRPDIESALVLRMLLYGLDGDLNWIDEVVGTNYQATGPLADVSRLIAAAFVVTAERSLQRSPKREYRRIVENRTVLAGRPLWTRTFDRPLSLAIPCEIYMLETNTLVQRLLLAAAGMAVKLLAETGVASRARRVLGLLETLATPHEPTRRDLDAALRAIAGPNMHFRVPLLLARALLYGEAPDDPFETGADAFPGVIYDVPSIFERAVMRFLDRTLSRYGLRARYQSSVQTMLFDGSGRRYKLSRPDIQLLHAGRCVAIVDCKFKPRYITDAKVSSADVYQVLFYGEIAPRRDQVDDVALAILAPRMSGTILAKDSRTIIADRAGGKSIVRVLPIDMARLLDAARVDDEVGYLRRETELHDFFRSLTRRSASGAPS